jgi:hypothetical protein
MLTDTSLVQAQRASNQMDLYQFLSDLRQEAA